MSTLCRSALLACFVALMAAFAFASHVEARQGYGGFFWSGPYYQPSPWRQRYYSPPPKRHYAPSRKRKVVRSEQRRFSKSPKRRVALAVPGAGAAAAAGVQISINKVSQKMTVTVDGVEKYVWLVSTGRPAIRRRAAPILPSAWSPTITRRSGTMRRCRIRSSSHPPATPSMAAPTPSAWADGPRMAVSGSPPTMPPRSMRWSRKPG